VQRIAEVRIEEARGAWRRECVCAPKQIRLCRRGGTGKDRASIAHEGRELRRDQAVVGLAQLFRQADYADATEAIRLHDVGHRMRGDCKPEYREPFEERHGAQAERDQLPIALSAREIAEGGSEFTPGVLYQRIGTVALSARER
jgi:hypothetical protein